MVAKHRWGTPLDREHLIAIAAIDPNDYQEGREAFESLRTEPYVTNRGDRGIELDNGAFGRLADVLRHDCRWEPFEIRRRLKHYEG